MVDIVIGGVHKCGTTALHGYLSRHPEIVGGVKKELHFFDDPEIDWRDPDYQSYEASFKPRRKGQKWLDATPSYIYLPECLIRLKAYRPNVRLIFLFRDPLARAWSHWAMATKRGRETLDFDAAILAENERIRGYQPGDIGYKAYAYVDRAFYGRQLARALDVFPREQILCLTTEMLLEDPECILERVCAHVGISPYGPVNRHEWNKGPKRKITLESGTKAFIRSMLSDDIRWFSQLSGIDTRRWKMFYGA